MVDLKDSESLALVAAYLGAAPDELARAWRQGASLGTFAERYGRPRVGLEELLAKTLGRPPRAGSRPAVG